MTCRNSVQEHANPTQLCQHRAATTCNGYSCNRPQYRCLLLRQRQTGDREKFNNVLERDIWQFDKMRINDHRTFGILFAHGTATASSFGKPAGFAIRCDHSCSE